VCAGASMSSGRIEMSGAFRRPVVRYTQHPSDSPQNKKRYP